MKYYISETPLLLREYGRNIQSMVEYLKTLEDKEVRTAVAHEIVWYMTCLKPAIKENPDYKQQLWDYLYLIADGELDVDAPYEFPDYKPLHHPVAERMEYPARKPKYKAYGVNLELMVEKALSMEEGPIREEYINMLANAVKMTIGGTFDKSNGSHEEYIAAQIAKISGGKLKVDASKIRLSKVPLSHPHHLPQRSSKKGGNNQNKKSRGKGRPKRRR